MQTTVQTAREVGWPENLHYYFPPAPDFAPKTVTVDVCVYGGTSAGVIAAVQTARLAGACCC